MHRGVQDPVLLLAASADEVDCLAGLHDLLCKLIGKKTCRYHDMIQLVSFGPESPMIIYLLGVQVLHEEFLVRVVQLTLNHPLPDHGKNRSAHLS